MQLQTDVLYLKKKTMCIFTNVHCRVFAACVNGHSSYLLPNVVAMLQPCCEDVACQLDIHLGCATTRSGEEPKGFPHGNPRGFPMATHCAQHRVKDNQCPRKMAVCFCFCKRKFKNHVTSCHFSSYFAKNVSLFFLIEFVFHCLCLCLFFIVAVQYASL